MSTDNNSEYVYVVYWLYIDCDKARRSTTEILGVYTEEKEALRVENSHNRRKPSCDDICYTSIEKIELNKINLWSDEVEDLDEDN